MHRCMTVGGLALICVAIVMISGAQAAGEGVSITINQNIEYAESSGAPEKVKDECKLQTRLPQFIKDYAKKLNVVLVEEVGESTDGRVLQIEIVNVIGAAGGAWSGAKSVTVEGKLTENGEVIGTFTSKRFSGGGAFGGYKGTCSILGRCIKAMGSDIATWLANPTMDAKLGDA